MEGRFETDMLEMFYEPRTLNQTWPDVIHQILF